MTSVLRQREERCRGGEELSWLDVVLFQEFFELADVEIGEDFAAVEFQGWGEALAGDFPHVLVVRGIGQHVDFFELVVAGLEPIHRVDAPWAPDLHVEIHAWKVALSCAVCQQQKRLG